MRIKITAIISLTGLFAFLLLIASCTKNTTSTTIPPTVDAGPSQTITLPTDTITLSGSATDTIAKVVGYEWSQVSGPSATTIVDDGNPNTLVTGFVQGTYVFQLEATDSKGITGVDTMTVVVNPGLTKTLTQESPDSTIEYCVCKVNGVDASNPITQGLIIQAWTWDSDPVYFRFLIQFNLNSIPASAKIQSAHLYLYSDTLNSTQALNGVVAVYGADNSFTIQQISGPWTASNTSTNWSNPPSVTTANQVVVPSTTQSFQDLNIDVTAMVTSMVNNNANYGFYVRLQNEVIYTGRSFIASHNSVYPNKYPKLVVTYQ